MDEKGSFKISKRAMCSKFEERVMKRGESVKITKFKKKATGVQKITQKIFLEKKIGVLKMIHRILRNNLKPISGAIKSCFNNKILK